MFFRPPPCRCRIPAPTTPLRLRPATTRSPASPLLAHALYARPRLPRPLSTTRPVYAPKTHGDDFDASAWISGFRREDIAREDLTIAFSRSGGPGGQNVNKVNTKVDMRFPIKTVQWLPEPVKQKLWETHGARINKRAEFVVSSDRHRTQNSNLEDCIGKLHEAITLAAESLVVREPTEELLERIIELKRIDKEKKIKAKERHGSKKAHRKGGRGDF